MTTSFPQMGFTGGFTGGFVRKAPCARTAHTVFVRQGGMRAYMERMYRVVVTDNYRLARLEQSVRADMTRRDPRLATGTLKLSDGSGRTISSVQALDRLLATASPAAPPVLVYSVDTSIAPAPPAALPPLAPLQSAPSAREPVTNTGQLETLRRDIATQLGARLGAGGVPSREAVHNAAVEVLCAQRRRLAALTGAPVRATNSIAADLAVSVREVSPAVLTSSNATRAIAAAVEKSHAWCVLAPRRDDRAPDDNGPLFDLEPAPALVAASLGTTVVQLPIARVSSAAPVCAAVHTIAPLAAEVDVLAHIGFRAHTAADYTVELVGEQLTACGSCQAIGYRRCGRRCRRNLKRLEEQRAFEKATAAPAAPAKVGGNITFEPLGAPIADDIQFVPLAAGAPIADDIQFVPLAASAPIARDIQFVPLAASEPIAANIQFVPLAAAIPTAPIDCGTCDKGKKKKAVAAVASEAKPLDVGKAQPARVMAQAPTGYSVVLRDGTASTAVGATPVEVRGGPRHIELVNAEGKRRVATDEPVLFMPGQLMVVRVEKGSDGALGWSCHAAEHVGAQLAAALPAAATPVPANHLLLVHSDGTTAVAPAAGWARASGSEHEARTTCGRSYFFDMTRRFVADADNKMHPVLAAVPHATAPGATVVLLPAMTAPHSD
jgi:hypothetical protein